MQFGVAQGFEPLRHLRSIRVLLLLQNLSTVSAGGALFYLKSPAWLEPAKIDAALTTLEGLTSGSSTGHRSVALSTNGTGKKRRKLSTAARKAIGDAQSRRWAKQKRLAKA